MTTQPSPEGSADGPDVAALLAEHWSYEPTQDYDGWLCECGARIMGRDGDTDTAMQAHAAAVLADRLAAVTEQRDQYAAQAWDEAVQAFAWALDHGPPESAVVYVLSNNPYRAALRADGEGAA